MEMLIVTMIALLKRSIVKKLRPIKPAIRFRYRDPQCLYVQIMLTNIISMGF